MRTIFFLFIASISYSLTAQSISSAELLEKSIAYHDPSDQWASFKGTLYFDLLSPTNSNQNRRIVKMDRENNLFEFTSLNKDTLISSWDGNNCSFMLNGKRMQKEDLFMRNLTCDRTLRYRDYYNYLYGLPMKLKDPGTIIDQKVIKTDFNGLECLSFRVHYDTAVGKDTWDFFFDPNTFAMVGYRFYHDIDKNDGEYITLYGEENIEGIKMPKNRFWYYNINDKFLGADLLQPATWIQSDPKDAYDLSAADELRYNSLNNKKVFNLHVYPTWIENGEACWFIEYFPESKVYQKIDPTTKVKKVLFDHNQMALHLSNHFKEDLDPNDLDLRNLIYKDKDTLTFTKNDQTWSVDLTDYNINAIPQMPSSEDIGTPSPDNAWTIFAKDYNLYLKNNQNAVEIKLSSDGIKNYEYGSYYGWFDKMEGENGERPEHFGADWSPDSKYVITRICDTRNANKMYMLDFSQKDAFRPNLWSYYRGSPGDTNMVLYKTIIVDIENQKILPLNLPITTHINTISHHWSEKENNIYLRIPARGYLQDEIRLLDLSNLEGETIIEEKSNTGIDYFSTWYEEGLGVIIYTSEKSGWNQLYCYDLDQKKSRPLTQGEFIVNELVHIDTLREEIYFLASGKEEGYNPYWQQLYKVSKNGGEVVRLTPEKAHHSISLSPGGKYFVDNYSTINSPTTTIVRSTDSGQFLVEITKADVSRLYAENWVPPHSFETTAKDGKTKIYGALWKPTDFNPHKKYPIIDHSYTGPHTQMYPTHFISTLNRDNQALAELGFIVLMVDGMGTTGRSKAFQDVSYKNMGKNLEDHVLAIRQLGNRYSWIDTTRVGIFGHSAGGYDAAHALLEFPDFYKVGVASSGDHDFRMEKAWWPEMYMGWPVDSTYHEVSNITMADRLKGKLLLVHGAMDDNVNASATFKFIEALVEADKEFDLLILPSQRHGYQGKHADYFRKKRWKYFVEHLLK